MNYKNHKQYRLKDFDYSGEGDYFVTICINNRIKYLGKIKNDKIVLSNIGRIVVKTWNEIPKKFENIILDIYQVMPDHFHGIITIKPGRHLIHQMSDVNPWYKTGNIINDVPTFKSHIKNNPMEIKLISLGRIIRRFKGRVTFDSKKIIPTFAWQARYYDRVIRNDKEYYFISEYIVNNPVNYGQRMLFGYLNSLQNVE